MITTWKQLEEKWGCKFHVSLGEDGEKMTEAELVQYLDDIETRMRNSEIETREIILDDWPKGYDHENRRRET